MPTLMAYLNNISFKITEPEKARRGSHSILRVYYLDSGVHSFTVVCRVSGLQASDAWQVISGHIDPETAHKRAYTNQDILYACRTKNKAYDWIVNRVTELNSKDCRKAIS